MVKIRLALMTYANKSSKLIVGRFLAPLLMSGNKQKKEQARRAAINSWNDQTLIVRITPEKTIAWKIRWESLVNNCRSHDILHVIVNTQQNDKENKYSTFSKYRNVLD